MTNNPYGYTPDKQGTIYQINPREAAEVRRLFEQVATKGVAIYARTSAPGKEATPKRAAIYARVAVSQELGDSYGLEAQVKACQAHCEQRGYILEHVYKETASGAQLDRPMLDVLRQAAREHQFTVLVIWDYARLARNTVRLTVLLRELEETGVTLESVQQDQCKGDVTCFLTMAQEYMAAVQREQFIRRMKHGKQATHTRREQKQQQ